MGTDADKLRCVGPALPAQATNRFNPPRALNRPLKGWPTDCRPAVTGKQRSVGVARFITRARAQCQRQHAQCRREDPWSWFVWAAPRVVIEVGVRANSLCAIPGLVGIAAR